VLRRERPHQRVSTGCCPGGFPDKGLHPHRDQPLLVRMWAEPESHESRGWRRFGAGGSPRAGVVPGGPSGCWVPEERRSFPSSASSGAHLAGSGWEGGLPPRRRRVTVCGVAAARGFCGTAGAFAETISRRRPKARFWGTDENTSRKRGSIETVGRRATTSELKRRKPGDLPPRRPFRAAENAGDPRHPQSSSFGASRRKAKPALIDEAHHPDSFPANWPAAGWRSGGTNPGVVRQAVRPKDWLEFDRHSTKFSACRAHARGKSVAKKDSRGKIRRGVSNGSPAVVRRYLLVRNRVGMRSNPHRIGLGRPAPRRLPVALKTSKTARDAGQFIAEGGQQMAERLVLGRRWPAPRRCCRRDRWAAGTAKRLDPPQTDSVTCWAHELMQKPGRLGVSTRPACLRVEERRPAA